MAGLRGQGALLVPLFVAALMQLASSDVLSASFNFQADARLQRAYQGALQTQTVVVPREKAPLWAIQTGPRYGSQEESEAGPGGSRNLVQWGDGSGYYNTSIAVMVSNENILVDDVLDVSFIPDNSSSPRVEYPLGTAQEQFSVCQAPRQGCRGNMFIPPELNGVCPTLYGDMESDFIACYQRPITNTGCTTSSYLSEIILPLASPQTSCIRLATSTWLQCGNVGVVKLYWIKNGAIFEPEKGGFARFIYYNPQSDPMDMLGCFVIPPFPSVSPTQSTTATNTPTATVSRSFSASATVTSSRTGTRTITPSSSETATVSASISFSKTASISLSSSATATSTASSTGSISYSASETASISFSRTVSRSFTPSVSISFSRSETPSTSFSQTSTGSNTASGTATATGTATASETPTYSRTGSNTRSPSATVSTSFSATVSISLSATSTSTRSETPSNTVTPSNSATNTASSSFTKTGSATMSESLSATVSTSFSGSSTKTRTETATRSSTSSETPSNSRTGTSSKTETSTVSISLSPTVSRSFSSSISATPSETPSFTGSGTQSRSNSGTPTSTRTPSSTVSISLTGTVTRSFSATISGTASETASYTGSGTQSRSNTGTPTPTRTASSTLSISLSGTVSQSFSATVTASSSETATASVSISQSRTQTITSSESATRSETATVTQTASNSKTGSKTPASTLSRTASITASSTATSSETASPSETSSFTQTGTHSRTASSTRTSSRTASNSETATNSHTAAVTQSPTKSETASISATSTRSASQTTTPTSTSTQTSSPTTTSTNSETPSRTAFPSGPSTPSISPWQSESPTRTALVTPSPTETNSTANVTMFLAMVTEATPRPLTGEEKIGIVAGLLGFLFLASLCGCCFWIFGMPRYRKWRKQEEKKKQKELKKAAAAAALAGAKTDAERLKAQMQALKAGGYGNKGVAAGATSGDALVDATPMFSLRLKTDKNKQAFPPTGDDFVFGQLNALHQKKQEKIERAAAAAKKKDGDDSSSESEKSNSTNSDEEEEETPIPAMLAPVKPVAAPPPRRPGPSTNKKAQNMSEDPIFAGGDQAPPADSSGAVDPLFALSNPLRAPVPSVTKATQAPTRVHRNSMALSVPQHVAAAAAAAEAMAAPPPMPPPSSGARRLSALSPQQLAMEVESAPDASGAFAYSNEMMMMPTTATKLKPGQLSPMDPALGADDAAAGEEREKRRSGRRFFLPVVPADSPKKKDVVAPPKASWMGDDSTVGRRPSSTRLYGTEVGQVPKEGDRPRSSRLSLTMMSHAISSAFSTMGSLLSGAGNKEKEPAAAAEEDEKPIKAPAPKGMGPSAAVQATKKKFARQIPAGKSNAPKTPDAGRQLLVGEGLIETESVKKETVALRHVPFVKGDEGFSQRRLQRFQSMSSSMMQQQSQAQQAAVLADGRGIVEEPQVSQYSFTGVTGRSKQKVRSETSNRRLVSQGSRASQYSPSSATATSPLPSGPLSSVKSLRSSSSGFLPGSLPGSSQPTSSLGRVGEDDDDDDDDKWGGTNNNDDDDDDGDDRKGRTLSPSSDLDTGRPGALASPVSSSAASASGSAVNTPARSVRSSVVPVAGGAEAFAPVPSSDGASAGQLPAARPARNSVANPFGGPGGLQAALAGMAAGGRGSIKRQSVVQHPQGTIN